MGTNEEDRQKAEEEIKKAFQDSLDYAENHPDEFKRFWTFDLKRLMEERISPITKKKYMGIIYDYLNKANRLQLDYERAERELLKALGSKRKHIF